MDHVRLLEFPNRIMFRSRQVKITKHRNLTLPENFHTSRFFSQELSKSIPLQTSLKARAVLPVSLRECTKTKTCDLPAFSMVLSYTTSFMTWKFSKINTLTKFQNVQTNSITSFMYLWTINYCLRKRNWSILLTYTLRNIHSQNSQTL